MTPQYGVAIIHINHQQLHSIKENTPNITKLFVVDATIIIIPSV